MTKSKVPAGLGERGSAFFRLAVELYEFEPVEEVLLEQAAQVLDRIGDLEALLEGAGLTQAGSLTINPAVAEQRQQRLLFDRLLRALALPTDVRSSSELGQQAAMARWRREGRVSG